MKKVELNLLSICEKCYRPELQCSTPSSPAILTDKSNMCGMRSSNDDAKLRFELGQRFDHVPTDT